MKLQEVLDCLNEIISKKQMQPEDEVVVCVRSDAADYATFWYQYDFDIYTAFEAGKRILVMDSNEHNLLLTKVEDEINLVAEYANLPEVFTFSAEPADDRSECWLHWGEHKALCNITWLLGNIKKCPDKCKPTDLLKAIAQSHPLQIRKR